jgi:AhpD family alkylhydroperoxidase
MSWIHTIETDAATGDLATLYKRIAGPGGAVDNILLAHSLRPHTMEGHMGLYKSVLHHRENTLPKWYLELVGVWTSRINGCGYCVAHHGAGLLRLLRRERRETGAELHAALLVGLAALEAGAEVDAAFGKLLTFAQGAGLDYATKLTRDPGAMELSDVDVLREAGWSDGEVLELNQVTSYFNYANRTVLGLGVGLAGDELGLSPSDGDDSTNWQHT